MESEIESKIRGKMLLDIFIVVQKLNRDNKTHYCNEHAMEKAKLIEDSLYTNCKATATANWSELYGEVNIDKLVNTIEVMTPKCLY